VNRGAKTAITAVSAGALLFVAYMAYQRLYAKPRGELAAQLATARQSIDLYDSKLEGAPSVGDALKGVAAGTLGDKLDTAEHRFRTTLNSIAEGCGLRDIKVDNRDPDAVRNPAGQQQQMTPRFWKKLREQVDFSVIRGTVGGTGTLDQVLRATAAISAQTWVHRVESFSIKPIGAEKERFQLKLAVATMFLPDLAARSAPEPARVELTASAADAWRPIVDRNVFKVPVPVVVAVTPDPPAPAPVDQPTPAPPAYAEWRLTGVVEGADGSEALLVNVRTNERSALPVGGAVLDAVFESGQGERAVFRIAAERFEVEMGSTLDQRQPVR
jgi:hypothetical protein